MFAREIKYVGFSLHTRLEKGKFDKLLDNNLIGYQITEGVEQLNFMFICSTPSNLFKGEFFKNESKIHNYGCDNVVGCMHTCRYVHK